MNISCKKKKKKKSRSYIGLDSHEHTQFICFPRFIAKDSDIMTLAYHLYLSTYTHVYIIYILYIYTYMNITKRKRYLYLLITYIYSALNLKILPFIFSLIYNFFFSINNLCLLFHEYFLHKYHDKRRILQIQVHSHIYFFFFFSFESSTEGYNSDNIQYNFPIQFYQLL